MAWKNEILIYAEIGKNEIKNLKRKLKLKKTNPKLKEMMSWNTLRNVNKIYPK